ncbi:hypothetical protein C8J57DRAFT_575760 [Mycena rebaudengoi]|nr:hypothetical protein C8J57DRAFT_575760 [Mycena rebaudengoi]
MASELMNLHLSDIVRVAGEILSGHVEMNMAQAQEDKLEHLRIKLRGSIVTKITEHKTVHEDGQTRTHNEVHTQIIELVRSDVTVWDHFSGAAQGPVMMFPFQFQLPHNLPPSFYASETGRTATISYSIEVVGDRPGLFHLNRRIRKIFSIVPAASPDQVMANEAMKHGWSGQWRAVHADEKLRQGIFGHHGRAKVEIVLPNLSSFPMSTGIPFSLHVETHTKELHYGDLEEKHGSLFPAPPTSSADIKLELHRRGRVHVHKRSQPLHDTFKLKGSVGDPESTQAVRVSADQPEWTPGSPGSPGGKKEKEKGVWKRTVHFEGRLSIPFVPTFKGDTVDWEYFLQFTVPFPGIGNDLDLEFPIHINSGSACPPPPQAQQGYAPQTQYGQGAPAQYVYPLPAGPPPMIQMPSAYWSGADHQWDDK